MGTPPGPTWGGLSCERQRRFHDRIKGGRKVKAGKQYFSMLFVPFFSFGYKFLLKINSDDSVNHEKGYLPCVPKDFIKLESITG